MDSVFEEVTHVSLRSLLGGNRSVIFQSMYILVICKQ